MEIRTTTSRGHSISYEEHGEGPPLVLVPGLGSPAREWRDRGYIEPLAGSFRVVVVDPLGHGLSDVPADPDEYRRPDVAEDVVAVMDAAGVDRALLWGYSRGSRLAAVVACEHPERVEALVLGGYFLPLPEPSFEITPDVEAMLRGNWGGVFEIWAEDGFELSESDRQYMLDYSHPAGVGASRAGGNRSSYVRDPAAITCPVFAYWASGDLEDNPEPAEICEILDIELAVLPGEHDHAEGFNDSGAALPLVLPFLKGR
jgi:pimeloyl-ACP methyl ester carboxylesterase